MAFHDLEALSPAAVGALAETAAALITAEGRETPSPREQELLAELFAALVGRPWPDQITPQLPAGLSGFITTTHQRQQVLQLLTVLAFLEPRLDQHKVALLERIAAELRVEAAVVADLQEVCRNHVLKAFGDMYRRTFHVFNDDSVVQGYARFILPMLGSASTTNTRPATAQWSMPRWAALGRLCMTTTPATAFPTPAAARDCPTPMSPFMTCIM